MMTPRRKIESLKGPVEMLTWKKICRPLHYCIKIVLLMIALFVGATNSTLLYAEEEERLDPQDVHIAIYTKEFQDRFSLPPIPDETRPADPLFAVEYSLEESEFRPGKYMSVFKLYLDDSLDIDYPEACGIGRKGLFNIKSHFFSGGTREKWLLWQLQDRRALSKGASQFHMKAFLATMDYENEKKGRIKDIMYFEHQKRFLQGISYIKIYEASVIKVKTSSGKPHGIWLKLKGGRNNLATPEIDRDDFLKLELPKPFINKINAVYAEIKK